MSQAPLALLGGNPAFLSGLPLVRPTIPDIPALTSRLGSILESGMLTNGRTVRELEEAAAALLDVPQVVAVSSCTAGLMLTLQALGARGPVVLPSFTFAASAHAVVWAGGRPVFADVQESNLTLDPADAAETVRAAGAAAMTATHVYGTPCEVERLQEVADAAGIPLVYDAAHALGSSRKGRPIGGFGTAEVFSLSPTKVTTAGEGGLVATSDEALAQALRIGRDYGNPGDYDCLFPGLNARMSELHAAIALAGLASVHERVAYRNELVQVFREAVGGVAGLRLPEVDEADVSTYKDLTLIVEPAAFGLTAVQLRAVLSAEGIDSRRYYFPPIHRQKAYAHLLHERPLPVTDVVADQVLTPPLYSHMTPDQVRAVADVVVRAHAQARRVRAALSMSASQLVPPQRSSLAGRPVTDAAYAPPSAPPGYLDGRTWSWTSPAYRALRHSFRVRSDDPTVADYLEEVFAALRTDQPAQATYSLLDRRPSTGAAFALYCDDERIALTGTRSPALATLLWHVNKEVVRRTAAPYVQWHAAAAVRDGVCVVLPAPMESGKTTTVAGLLLAGYQYLTDEAVAIHGDSLLVEPFPKALSVDRGSWCVLAELKPRLRPVQDQWQVPPARVRPDVVALPTQPRLVVLPRYRPDARTRLEPLRRSHALTQVAQSSFGFAEDPGRNLDVAARVLAACDCYELTIGDLATAVSLIDGLVDRVLEGAS